MTTEELKAHCKEQIAKCEAFWAEDEEKLKNHRLYQEHKLILELLEQEPCTDAVSREDVKIFIESFIHEIITESGTDKNAHTNKVLKAVIRGVGDIPPVTPERTTITYKDCSEAMLKMWIDNVLTDGQYNKIMDKLNVKHLADMRGVKNE